MPMQIEAMLEAQAATIAKLQEQLMDAQKNGVAFGSQQLSAAAPVAEAPKHEEAPAAEPAAPPVPEPEPVPVVKEKREVKVYVWEDPPEGLSKMQIIAWNKRQNRLKREYEGTPVSLEGGAVLSGKAAFEARQKEKKQAEKDQLEEETLLRDIARSEARRAEEEKVKAEAEERARQRAAARGAELDKLKAEEERIQKVQEEARLAREEEERKEEEAREAVHQAELKAIADAKAAEEAAALAVANKKQNDDDAREQRYREAYKGLEIKHEKHLTDHLALVAKYEKEK